VRPWHAGPAYEDLRSFFLVSVSCPSPIGLRRGQVRGDDGGGARVVRVVVVVPHVRVRGGRISTDGT
jgi:hypothetical protein